MDFEIRTEYVCSSSPHCGGQNAEVPAAQNGSVRRDLRRQLLRRREKDQQVRGKLVKRYGMAVSPGQLDLQLMQELEQVDRDNTAWLKSVIGERGWPGSSLVVNSPARQRSRSRRISKL